MDIACRAFIFNQDKILLCKQDSRNFWTLPGGSLEEGETLVDCIKREVSEEIRLNIEVDQMLYIRELIRQSRHRIEFYFSIIEITDKSSFEMLYPHNEIKEVQFFSIDELHSILIKPECLISLIEEIRDNASTFPRFLGNVE